VRGREFRYFRGNPESAIRGGEWSGFSECKTLHINAEDGVRGVSAGRLGGADMVSEGGLQAIGLIGICDGALGGGRETLERDRGDAIEAVVCGGLLGGLLQGILRDRGEKHRPEEEEENIAGGEGEQIPTAEDGHLYVSLDNLRWRRGKVANSGEVDRQVMGGVKGVAAVKQR